MLTDNRVLVDNLRELPALMCVQRKAKKKIVTEEDVIEANIASFGDEIGKITNRVTAMFEIQARYPKDSEEYRILDYRIKCGQLFQQNAIDKSKGIIAKPMPREWHDRHSAADIEDPAKRELYLSILADKKPYFMRYIYPDLMSQYNTYIRNTSKKAQREFSKTVEELLAAEFDSLTEDEQAFVEYYHRCMPVGTGDCVINRICRRFEERFDSYLSKRRAEADFDYTVMKSGVEYTKTQHDAIVRLYGEYNRKVRDYTVYASRERVDSDESAVQLMTLQNDFRRQCDIVCTDARTLCDIMLDVCYKRSGTKSFVWNMCGTEIVENLLANHDQKIIYPVADPNGDVEFNGSRFRFEYKKVGAIVEYNLE